MYSSAVFKAMGDEARLQILLILEQRSDVCAAQFIEIFGLSGAAVSRHLAVLEARGLVQKRKDERWIYWSLKNPALFAPLLAWAKAQSSLDWSKIESVLSLPPSALCKCQRLGHSFDASGRCGCCGFEKKEKGKSNDNAF